MTSSAPPVLDFGAVERSPTGWKSGWSGFLLLRSLREALRNSQSVDLLITTRPIQMNCDFLVALFDMQIIFRQQDKNSSFLFWFFMTVTWLQNLTALLMWKDWQCNHCSCKAVPVSHCLRFPFHPFCPRPSPFFCPRPRPLIKRRQWEQWAINFDNFETTMRKHLDTYCDNFKTIFR